MIESNNLGAAVGIQYQGVVDLSESDSIDAMTVGMIVGQFMRGYPYKPFKVNNQNYKILLGHTPNNPAYMAVVDALAAGMSEVWVVRTGAYTN